MFLSAWLVIFGQKDTAGYTLGLIHVISWSPLICRTGERRLKTLNAGSDSDTVLLNLIWASSDWKGNPVNLSV